MKYVMQCTYVLRTYVCMYACIYVCMCVFLFTIDLRAPLLCSNTTCIGGLLRNYIISTKIPCSIYKFVKLTIIVYNLSKGMYVCVYVCMYVCECMCRYVCTYVGRCMYV